MNGFKKFIRENEAVQESLQKLPKHHREFLDGFEFRFQAGNTLAGDDGHVGMIVTDKKVVTIAAPWNYGREFTLYHEIAHLVFAMYVKGTDLEEQWKKLVPLHKGRKKDENPEELWCHAYAATFTKNPPMVHYFQPWVDFIKRVCKIKKPRNKCELG